jgi:hypothetical protein
VSTFVPGYLTALTVNLVDLGIFGNVVGLNFTKTAPRKPVFGSQSQRTISGQIAGDMSASGHVAAEGPITDLLAALTAEVPLAFTLQAGEAAGATDAGSFAGNLVVTSLSFNADAEGEWDWSMAAAFDGMPVHTP